VFYKYRHLLMWLVFASFLGFITVYHYMTTLPEGQDEPENLIVGSDIQKTIDPETKVFLSEQYALCEKHRLPCRNESPLEGAARMELNDLNLNDVVKKYPEEAGWKIIWEDKKLVLQQEQPGLCPEHKNRWHLAADQTGKKVAVYVGPPQVGVEGGLIKTTDIAIDKLPLDLRSKITARYFEFLTWDDLIATLDSLSEKE